MQLPTNANRRTVLKAVGTGAAGSVALSGTVSGSPRNNFGYVADRALEGETLTLVGPPSRAKVRCDAGESESRIKTQVWGVEESDAQLYLIPSGYEGGDRVEVGSVFLDCTRNSDIAGEVSVTKVE